MQKENKKSGKQLKNTRKSSTVWYKDLRTYFVGILFLLMIVLVAQLFIVKIIPMKYILIGIAVLALLGFILWWLQYGKRVNKVNRILGKILIVVMSVLLIMGNLYLNKAGNVIGKITGSNTETDAMSVIVKKDSDIEKIEQLVDKKIGANEATDKENVLEAKKAITEEIGDTYAYQSYNNYDEEAAALYSGEIDAMILNEAYRGLLENNYPKFDEETRVIYTHEITKKVADISKDVDVTNTPFNVYISGIDTYGPVTTKSRSDVNMIATVNPNTHVIVLTSIPRDYYIAQTCQGGAQDKLTHTGIFGVDCTVSSVEQYFGIDINYYARVNFTSLIDIVDALGGITVDNPNSFSGNNGTYFPVDSELYITGSQALEFARERYAFSDGDRERGRNQMRVLTGMINKAISPAIITNYTSIMNAIGGSFQTNMSSDEISSLIHMQLNEMSGWDIIQQSVNGYGEMLISPANGFNSYMMIPNVDTVNAAVSKINEVMNSK